MLNRIYAVFLLTVPASEVFMHLENLGKPNSDPSLDNLTQFASEKVVSWHVRFSVTTFGQVLSTDRVITRNLSESRALTHSLLIPNSVVFMPSVLWLLYLGFLSFTAALCIQLYSFLDFCN